MTRAAIERLAYAATHRVLALEGDESLAIEAKRYATNGKRRSLRVDRIAAEIASVFELASDEHELDRLIGQEVRQEAAE